MLAGSAKGSPGVTTALVALALCWPRDVLLVEADPAGSDLRAGLLQATVPADRGLLSLALAARRSEPVVSEHAVAVHGGRVWAVPGVSDPAQREAVLPVWPKLVGSMAGSGRDVLVDAGRIDPALPLVVGAEPAVLLLVLAPTMAGVDRAYPLLSRLRPLAVSERGAARLGLLVVGDGPYPAGEVAVALDTPVLGTLPADRRAAQALGRGRIEWRSPLLRAARGVAADLADALRPATDLAGAAVTG